MNELSSLISSVGFPIFACSVMFMQQKELNQAIVKLTITLDSINERIENIERGM